jgi:hypothetical protein
MPLEAGVQVQSGDVVTIFTPNILRNMAGQFRDDELARRQRWDLAWRILRGCAM